MLTVKTVESVSAVLLPLMSWATPLLALLKTLNPPSLVVTITLAAVRSSPLPFWAKVGVTVKFSAGLAPTATVR